MVFMFSIDLISLVVATIIKSGNNYLPFFVFFDIPRVHHHLKGVMYPRNDFSKQNILCENSCFGWYAMTKEPQKTFFWSFCVPLMC